jgi:hypothetical protein
MIVRTLPGRLKSMKSRPGRALASRIACRSEPGPLQPAGPARVDHGAVGRQVLVPSFAVHEVERDAVAADDGARLAVEQPVVPVRRGVARRGAVTVVEARRTARRQDQGDAGRRARHQAGHLEVEEAQAEGDLRRRVVWGRVHERTDVGEHGAGLALEDDVGARHGVRERGDVGLVLVGHSVAVAVAAAARREALDVIADAVAVAVGLCGDALREFGRVSCRVRRGRGNDVGRAVVRLYLPGEDEVEDRDAASVGPHFFRKEEGLALVVVGSPGIRGEEEFHDEDRAGGAREGSDDARARPHGGKRQLRGVLQVIGAGVGILPGLRVVGGDAFRAQVDAEAVVGADVVASDGVSPAGDDRDARTLVGMDCVVLDPVTGGASALEVNAVPPVIQDEVWRLLRRVPDRVVRRFADEDAVLGVTEPFLGVAVRANVVAQNAVVVRRAINQDASPVGRDDVAGPCALPADEVVRGA